MNTSYMWNNVWHTRKSQLDRMWKSYIFLGGICNHNFASTNSTKKFHGK